MIDSSNHHTGRMQKWQDYIQALEAERCKIQVFQRELPLCLELVTQAIETCKDRLSGTTTEYNLNGQSECNSEQTSSDVPVLEEFIPIKRASSYSDDEEHNSKNPKNEADIDGKNCNDSNNGKKADWLRSVQLWNQNPDPPAQQDSPNKVAALELKRNGNCGAFHPFKKDKSGGDTNAAAPTTQKPENSSVPQPASTSSTAETGGDGIKKGGKLGRQSQRKIRRCWSPELHRRFLQALQQLGGSQVATPKQIRDLMKVDGLTNDEVKSHLQKYRLHTRRPSSSIHNNNNETQTPQFVVVGGLWPVPPEYVAMAAATASSGQATGAATSKTVYAPIAAPPPPSAREASASPRQENKPSNPDARGSNSEGGACAQPHSPATSSTQTTTVPPLS